MGLIILPEAKREDWAYENGKEKVWYDENPMTRHVVLTSPMTPSRVGYNRHSTTNPKEMDRVFKRLHEQEHEANEKLIEKLWGRGKAHYDAIRSRLTQRLLAADCKEWEKAFIRESLRLMNERDHKSQKNSVYGVSAMEESVAPLEGARVKVI